MNIYFILEKNLFNPNYLKNISKFGNIIFMSKNNEENYKILTKDTMQKVIVYDPDYAGWHFPNNILNSITNLKAVFLGTTDKSYIDLEICSRKNIDVINIPKYATNSVAEYLVMYMFALAKKIPLQIKNENKQTFTNEFMQIELSDKKVGIVGLGNIGSRIAEICSGIGMQVYYWNRSEKQCKYNYISLDKLFEDCDVIFICLSINDETKRLITDELLNSMKNSCILISGTGKQLFNSKLIEEKVKNNNLFGFAFESSDIPLDDYKGNVMVTSEYGWFTKEASELRLKKWYEMIINYLNRID